MPKSSPSLETYLHDVYQPPWGYIPFDTLTAKTHGNRPIERDTEFSRMLFSSTVRQLVGFCISGKHRAIEPLVTKALTRIGRLPQDEQEKERARLDKITAPFDAVDSGERRISAPMLAAVPALLSYAPLSAGGARHYPDGGSVTPTKDDMKNFYELARRSYEFFLNDGVEEMDFRPVYDVNADKFTESCIDFDAPNCVYKVACLTTPPQPRDTLLVYIWAILAGTERFCIYNPLWDMSYEGQVSKVPRDVADEIDALILKVS